MLYSKDPYFVKPFKGKGGRQLFLLQDFINFPPHVNFLIKIPKSEICYLIAYVVILQKPNLTQKKFVEKAQAMEVAKKQSII